MRPRLLDLAIHLTRLAGSILALALAACLRSDVAMIGASALLFLEAFAFMHDLAHGALLLPRWTNEVALSLAGALLLMSGHALRHTHLVHHACALADDDVEGRPARGSFAHALAGGPRATLALRLHAFRSAGPRGRRWQAAETALYVVILAVLVGSGRAPVFIYAGVALLGQVTMSVWAAHIPHNAPAWLTRLAARTAWIGSPTLQALAFHDLHHARPGVPCRRLAVGRRAPPLPA
jgi:fatty acid desaturase